MRFQSRLYPLRNALAAGCFGVISHPLLVPKKIVPVGDPVFRVFPVVRQKFGNQPPPLIRRPAVDKRSQIFRWWQQAPYVEISAAGEHRVRDQLRFADAVPREVIGH